MEPKSSSPEYYPSPEQQPEQDRGYEQSPETQLPMPESVQERRHEQVQQSPAGQSTIDPSQIALPTPVQPQTADNTTSATDDTPQDAADEDLIEKEWVDKAKQIITETKDDPHKRETEVGKLQADYLKKRYGKELGDAA